MYTIFVNDALICLTDDRSFEKHPLFYNYNEIEVNELLSKLFNSKTEKMYLYHENLNFLWSDFQKQFKIIEAAGGLVINDKEEVLWIYRNDKWDLPKGKIEKGEQKKDAAKREVEEECGINGLEIKEFIKTTYHIYLYKNQYVLKPTYWFLMFTKNTQKLTPQLEEGITKVDWIHTNRINAILAETYGNIRQVFKENFLSSN